MLRRLPLMLALLAFPLNAFAHQLDEYLQATIVSIEPDDIRLEMSLTPGVAIVGRILGVIDTNRDDQISPHEAEAYAELLKRDLSVRMDGSDMELKRITINFPEPDEMRGGWGIFRIGFDMAPGALTAGVHRIGIENKHFPAMSVYLVNAAQPKSGSVNILRQIRSQNQSTAEVEFTLQQPAKSFNPFGVAAALPAMSLALAGARWARKFCVG